MLTSSAALWLPPRWWPKRANVTASKMLDLPLPLVPESIHRGDPSKRISCSSLYERNPDSFTRWGIITTPKFPACHLRRSVWPLRRKRHAGNRSGLHFLEQPVGDGEDRLSFGLVVLDQLLPQVVAHRLGEALVVAAVAADERGPKRPGLLPVPGVPPGEDAVEVAQHLLQLVRTGRVADVQVHEVVRR